MENNENKQKKKRLLALLLLLLALLIGSGLLWKCNRSEGEGSPHARYPTLVKQHTPKGKESARLLLNKKYRKSLLYRLWKKFQ